MKCKSLTRVLALDLHPRRFGYVVVEGPDRLLDWGVRSHRHKGGSADALIRRLRSLLELWRPTALVVQRGSRTTPRPNPSDGRLLKRIATETKRYRAPLRIGPELSRSSTKYENARLAAEQFPVLIWNLPSKRKPWESEDYRMSMFTAAWLGRTYLSSEDKSSIQEWTNLKANG
jgi:hypothetical protein